MEGALDNLCHCSRHPHRGLGRAAEVGRKKEECQAECWGLDLLSHRDDLVTTLTNNSHVSMPVLRARRQDMLLSTLAAAYSSAGYASLCADQQDKLV